MLVVAVTADLDAAFRRPVRWPVGRIDPRWQFWVQLLLPRGPRGEAHLFEDRGGRTVIAAHELAEAEGFAGARLVAFGLNTELAYGHRYAARTGKLTVPIATRVMPAGVRRESWSFIAVSPRERVAFLRVVDSAPRLLRRILGEIDGAVIVAGDALGCSVADACEHDDEGTVTLSLRRFDR